MQFAYKEASKHAGKMADKNKTIYYRKVQESVLEVGDSVLVRNVGLKGKLKLADKWAEQPYLVVSMPDPTVPVYRVRAEHGTSIRTLHRNMLLPFTCTPAEQPEPEVELSRRKSGRTRTKPSSKPVLRRQQSDSEDSSEESSDSSGLYIIPQRRQNPKRRWTTKSSGSMRNSAVHRTNSTVHSIDSSAPLEVSFPSNFRSGPADSNTHSESGAATSGSSVFEDTRSIEPSIETPGTDRSQSRPEPRPEITQVDLQSSDRAASPEPEPQPQRRSGRARKPPDRFGQWVTSQTVCLDASEDEIFV